MKNKTTSMIYSGVYWTELPGVYHREIASGGVGDSIQKQPPPEAKTSS